MELRHFLQAIGISYDRHAGFDTDAQHFLTSAARHLADYAPLGYEIKGSGGQRPLQTTFTPWVGFFDPDAHASPQEGLYLVFILRADLSAWTLSLNMGTERFAREHGNTKARAHFTKRAADIRGTLASTDTLGWDSEIDLARHTGRQRLYEAAGVVGRFYPLPDLPSDQALKQDLHQLVALYQRAIGIEHELALAEVGTAATGTHFYRTDEDVTYEFAPGADRPTQVLIKGGMQTRTPRHQTGLRLYGKWLQGRGLKPSAKDVHPRDFVVLGPHAWLGEYKVVYGGNTTQATREAHTQLKEYSYFLYGANEKPNLLAVFSDPIPAKRAEWLENEGIISVWFEDGRWRGTEAAVALRMAE